MVSQTIEENLRPYQIGPKLRALRLKKSMGLVELGKHAGLSPALLSKLERDKLYPTLPTLLRIAMVFSVGLDYFFSDERKRHVVSVVRKDERIRLPERPGVADVAYHFVKGRLGLKIGLDDYELEAGDSIYFDATLPHTYRRLSKSLCQAMIVTAA